MVFVLDRQRLADDQKIRKPRKEAANYDDESVSKNSAHYVSGILQQPRYLKVQ